MSTRSPTPGLPLLAATLALALAPLQDAHAARWISINKDATALIEVDGSSIDRSGEKVRAWHRETYQPKRMQETGAFSYASLKQLTEFQCDKRSAAIQRRIYFADNGTEIKSESPDSKDGAPVVPDSPTEAVFSHVCRKPAPKAPEPEPPKPAPAPEPTKPAKGKSGKDAPPPPPPKPPTPWSYEGKSGPKQWGKLDPDYALCASGERQSPIDIRSPIRGDLPALKISYKVVPLNLIDDGHGISVNAPEGGSILIDGEEFELQAFRFHRPGEPMINGKRAAMDVQFEHKAKSGRIAMLSVPIQEGKEHRLVRLLWSALPLEPGKAVMPAGVKVDPGQLLPAKREYITYSGSLTTPPCSEGVLWVVMKQAIPLSKEQIADFGKIYKNNVRPVQPANGRVIKESR